MAKINQMTNILGHDISWRVDAKKVKELDPYSIEHIEKLISDGYTQGELNVLYGNKETCGWWRIINWRDIALELRNTLVDNMHAFNNMPLAKSNVQKALAHFDEEWVF